MTADHAALCLTFYYKLVQVGLWKT